MTPFRRLRRHRAGVAALACAGLAVLLALLAVDARSWQRTISRDDLRFRALPAHRALWQPAILLPGDPASALIGTGSTIAYRRALQYFWYSRVGSNPDVRQDTPTLRAGAQNRLEQLIASAPNAHQRSTAANLLGVLVITTPTLGSDPSAVMQIFARSAFYFRQAIALDPGNLDAKQNLELVLRLQRPGKGSLDRDARAGYGFGRGHAASRLGNGY
jgi:hypothetical protein